MPKIKKEKKQQRRYSEETVQKALNEIKNGATKKATALKYGIPRATLQFRLSEKFQKTEKGPCPILTKEEEQSLVNWILESQKKGFPRRKEDIQASVKSFLDAAGRNTPFKDNMPGKHWYEAFLRRHPILVHRTSEAVTSASANVAEADIRKWFEQIENYLKEKGYFSILEDSTRVFNGDETCFLFCPKMGKVIAPRGAKNVYEVDQGDAKQNLTVMFTFSASGDITHPLIIYPNKRLSATIQNSIPDNWGIGLSDNGWMKAEIFVDYIKNILHPYIIEKGITLPIILFLEGHNIILIALYPNTTRILQPADVSSFKPLKNGWIKAVLEWRRQNPYIKLGKEHFAPILKKALTNLKSETVIKGFEACGLHPWNPDRIDFSKCLGRKSILTVKNENEKNFEKLMTFRDFSEIVGKDKILELENDLILQKCESCNILKRVYKYFENKLTVSSSATQNNDESTIEITENNDGSMVDFNMSDTNTEKQIFSKEEIEDMPLIFDNKPLYVKAVSPKKLPYNDQIFIHSNIKILEPKAFNVEEKAEGLFKTVTSPKLRIIDSKGGKCDSSEMSSEEDSCIDEDPKDTKEQTQFNRILNISDQTKQDIFENSLRNALDHDSTNNDNDVNQNYFMLDDLDQNTDENLENIPEIMVSKQSVEFSLNSCESEIMEEPRTLNLEDFLPKAKTPQRKNKIQMKRTSFVITSSAYKKEMEEKKKKKEELERQKEENRQKRLKRKLETEANSKESKRSKADEKQRKRGKKSNDTDCVDAPAETHKSAEYHQEEERKTKTTDEETPEINNILKRTGLCFSCVKNITLNKIGIKCQDCNRAYHMTCLKKRGLFQAFYRCGVCTVKLSVRS